MAPATAAHLPPAPHPKRAHCRAHVRQIPYLTLIDRYVFVGSGNIVLASVCHAALGFMQNWAGVQHSVLELANKVMFVAVCIAWTANQLFFARLALRSRRRLPSELARAASRRSESGGRRSESERSSRSCRRITRDSTFEPPEELPSEPRRSRVFAALAWRWGAPSPRGDSSWRGSAHDSTATAGSRGSQRDGESSSTSSAKVRSRSSPGSGAVRQAV